MTEDLTGSRTDRRHVGVAGRVIRSRSVDRRRGRRAGMPIRGPPASTATGRGRRGRVRRTVGDRPTASAVRSPRATDPWPSVPNPVSSGYGWTSPTSTPSADAPSPPRRRRPGLLIAGVTALVVAVLLSGAIGFAIDSRSHSGASSPAAIPFIPGPLPTSPGGSSIPTPSTTIPRSARLARPGPSRSRDGRRASVGCRRVAQRGAHPAREPARPAHARPVQRHVRERAPPDRPVAGRRRRCIYFRAVPEHRSRAVPQSGRVGAGVHRVAQGQCRRVLITRSRARSARAPATTVFHAPPDGTWPHVPTVDPPGLQLHRQHSGEGRRYRPPPSTRSRCTCAAAARCWGSYFANPDGRRNRRSRANARSRASSACSKPVWPNCRRPWSGDDDDAASRGAGHELQVELERTVVVDIGDHGVRRLDVRSR